MKAGGPITIELDTRRDSLVAAPAPPQHPPPTACPNEFLLSIIVYLTSNARLIPHPVARCRESSGASWLAPSALAEYGPGDAVTSRASGPSASTRATISPAPRCCLPMCHHTCRKYAARAELGRRVPWLRRHGRRGRLSRKRPSASRRGNRPIRPCQRGSTRHSAYWVGYRLPRTKANVYECNHVLGW